MQNNDDWEKPDEFYQILQVGGFCHNVDKASRDEVMEAIGGLTEQYPISLVDIYGDEALIIPKYVVGIKQWTRVGGLRYENSRHQPGFED